MLAKQDETRTWRAKDIQKFLCSPLIFLLKGHYENKENPDLFANRFHAPRPALMLIEAILFLFHWNLYSTRNKREVTSTMVVKYHSNNIHINNGFVGHFGSITIILCLHYCIFILNSKFNRLQADWGQLPPGDLYNTAQCRPPSVSPSPCPWQHCTWTPRYWGRYSPTHHSQPAHLLQPSLSNKNNVN